MTNRQHLFMNWKWHKLWKTVTFMTIIELDGPDGWFRWCQSVGFGSAATVPPGPCEKRRIWPQESVLQVFGIRSWNSAKSCLIPAMSSLDMRYVPSRIVTHYVLYSWYPWEACSFWRERRNGFGGEGRWGKGNWEETKERKLWSWCNIWEKKVKLFKKQKGKEGPGVKYSLKSNDVIIFKIHIGEGFQEKYAFGHGIFFYLFALPNRRKSWYNSNHLFKMHPTGRSCSYISMFVSWKFLRSQEDPHNLRIQKENWLRAGSQNTQYLFLPYPWERVHEVWGKCLKTPHIQCIYKTMDSSMLYTYLCIWCIY